MGQQAAAELKLGEGDDMDEMEKGLRSNSIGCGGGMSVTFKVPQGQEICT